MIRSSMGAKRLRAICWGLGWAAATCVAAPDLSMPATFSTVEGTAETVRIEIPVTLSEPSAQHTYFRIELMPGSALVPGDVVDACWGCGIAPGETSGVILLDILADDRPEPDETFQVSVAIWDVNTGSPATTTVTITDDDAGRKFLTARADRFVLAENTPTRRLPVLANDTFVNVTLAASPEITQQAAHGVVSVDTSGTVEPGDDRIRYTPVADWSGDDSFVYRICATGGDGCRDAEVQVVVRPALDIDLTVNADGGFRDVQFGGMRALPAAGFVADASEGGYGWIPRASVDATPETPGDGRGGDFEETRQILSSGASARMLLFDAIGTAGNADLYVEFEKDGGGPPLRCTSASTRFVEHCELLLSGSDTGNLRIRAHNRAEVPQDIEVWYHEVPLPDPGATRDDRLVATGPGRLTSGAAFPLRLAWSLPGATSTSWLRGVVRLYDGAVEVGRVPVSLRFGETVARHPIALSPSEPRTIWFGAGSREPMHFVDVPAGAESMTIHFEADGAVVVRLIHEPSPPSPVPGPAPPSGPDDAVFLYGEAVLEGTALKPGRWHVSVQPSDPYLSYATVGVSFAGNAPAVRAGSYFNPSRGGHGLFLYPAAGGATWTGLWYTYFQDSTPTWLYLEAAAPATDGVWESGVYRAAWHGPGRSLTRVGTAVLTPTGPDAFTWTYRLDGETGSEPMQALGRGCPLLAGEPVDASATWYDPAHAGTGVSTQLWGGEGYEYYAAFVYDALGVPRFLTAEASAFAGAGAEIDLEQLSGFCPRCARSAAPSRTVVGTLSRDFGGGTLERILVEATYAHGVPGVWAAEDVVVPLGGDGATQGCEP